MHSDSHNSAVQDLIDKLRTKIGANCVMVTEIADKQRRVRFFSDVSGATHLGPFTREESICSHVHDMSHPLIIEDARSHPLIKDNPSVVSSAVGAYAGFPLFGLDQRVIAVFCVLFDRIHRFSAEERRKLADAAQDISEMMVVVD